MKCLTLTTRNPSFPWWNVSALLTIKKNSYSPKIQRSESFNNASGFVSITLSEASQTLDETSAGAPRKSAFKANHRYPKRVPPCSAGLLRESTELTLSKRLEHPEKTNPMPEFSDRAADGTRALWSQSSGPGAPSCTFSGRRMTGVFQSPGFYSRRFDVAFTLFTWVGFNLTHNGFDAQSKCQKK